MHLKYLSFVLFTIHAVMCLGCGARPPAFGGVQGSSVTVGSLIVHWDKPEPKTTPVCNAARADAKIAKDDTTGNASATQEITAKINASLSSWLSGTAEYNQIDSISVKLEGGKLESGVLEDILLPFDKLSDGCKDAIKAQHAANARIFKIVTKLYRGKVTVTVNMKRDASIEAKAKALDNISAGISSSYKSDGDSSIAVDGGVWLLADEPYPL